MKWPFVSRGRYRRLLKKLRAVELEKKALLDHILGVPDLLADALPNPNSKEAEEMVDPATGTLTASAMKAIARKEMYSRAQISGKR